MPNQGSSASEKHSESSIQDFFAGAQPAATIQPAPEAVTKSEAPSQPVSRVQLAAALGTCTPRMWGSFAEQLLATADDKQLNFIANVAATIPGLLSSVVVSNGGEVEEKDEKIIDKAAEANKEAVAEVMAQYVDIGGHGQVLEVGSGTGQHVSYFATIWPSLYFTPSDRTDKLFTSIRAHVRHAEVSANVAAPIVLNMLADVGVRYGGENGKEGEAGVVHAGSLRLVVSTNTLHALPWDASARLMRVAAVGLREEGLLIVSGPFFSDDACQEATEALNVMDAMLRERDAECGVRRVEAVVGAATLAGLVFVARHTCPFNEFALVFRKPSPEAIANANLIGDAFDTDTFADLNF